MSRVRVDVPATFCGFAPSHGTIAVALALFNTIELALRETGLHFEIEGYGAESLPRSIRNEVVRAANAVFRRVGCAPSGLDIVLTNQIPLGDGLGSNIAFALGGLIAANELVGGALSRQDLTALAFDLGHNAAGTLAVLNGGLAVAARSGRGAIFHKVNIAPLEWHVVSAISSSGDSCRQPDSDPSALTPDSIGLTALLIQALAEGRDSLLGELAMTFFDDLGHSMPDSDIVEAIRAARREGSSAAFADRGGHAIIALASSRGEAALDAMAAAMRSRNSAEVFARTLPIETHGISVSETEVSFGGAPPRPISAGGKPISDSAFANGTDA